MKKTVFLVMIIAAVTVLLTSGCARSDMPVELTPPPIDISEFGDVRFLGATYSIDSETDTFVGVYNGEVIMSVAGDSDGETLNETTRDLFRRSVDAGTVADHDLPDPLSIFFAGEIPVRVDVESGWRFNEAKEPKYYCGEHVRVRECHVDSSGELILSSQDIDGILRPHQNEMEHTFSGIRLTVYYAGKTVSYFIAYDDSQDWLKGLEAKYPEMFR